LWTNKTEVLAEEEASQLSGEARGAVWATSHVRVDLVVRMSFHHYSDLGVMLAQLRTIIQIGGPTDNSTVVGDEKLGVDVEFFGDEGV
jgi:hypothetical protein